MNRAVQDRKAKRQQYACRDWRSEGYTAVVVSECRGSVSAVEQGARQDSVGKASTVGVDWHEGEWQTQHPQWLEGRQHPPRVVRRGVVEGALSEVCGTAQLKGRC